MAKIITVTPVTEEGPVKANVPFHRYLYTATGTISSRIQFNPVVEIGTPEEFRPIPGATTIYNLYADGLNIPTFSSDFIREPRSQEYNSSEGALNQITFKFDGYNFWYTIATLQTEQWLELVGDFGYGSDLIVLSGADVNISGFVYEGNPTGMVTAFDILTSVHYTGSNVLTYSISLAGTGQWFEHSDPRKAALSLDCNLLGQQDVAVKVDDGEMESDNLVVQVTYSSTHCN
jgi:hypothetical protein